ncbi:hypothetical protein [Roseibium sp. Sym1]|uniref:hypothetical protein n=1 Tax=Roseibium sp. Sym1 TaxID=3016006 RepID=UPI0022B3A25C|nr:hypothetical protein [Roseibium sp. Sym1]
MGSEYLTVAVVLIAIVVVAAVAAALLFGSVVHALSRNPVPPWDTAVTRYAASEHVPVVVSLTTMPNRLQGKTIRNVLASVLAQDPAPQAVEINIPYEMKRLGTQYTLPQWLIDSPVDIHRCEDLGPATKYVSTLQRYADKNADQKILVVDDDMIMPAGLVGAANASMDAHPDCAVCGHGMVLKGKGTPQVKLSLTNFVTGHKTILRVLSEHRQDIRHADDVQRVDLVTGYQGYGVRPRFFEIEKLADYAELPDEAVFVDDMVISARLAERNVPRIVCGSFKTFTLESAMTVVGFLAKWLKNCVKPNYRSETLSNSVNRSNHNNDVVARHFWKVW